MDDKTYREFQKNWAKVIAKCWMDPAFKENLLKNPQEALKEFEIIAPANVQFKVVENNKTTLHLVIPQKPEGELSEELLQKISGGFCYASKGGCTTT